MRVAVISTHTCPLAALGGKETGGMNVYVRETSRELAKHGVLVDIFTRSQHPSIPRVSPLTPGANVIHITAGPERPIDKYSLLEHLPAFIEGICSYLDGGYDLIQSHYWISGMVALELRGRWKVPMVHMFHTLGYLKNRAAKKQEEKEHAVRMHWEWEVTSRANALIASQPLERAQLIWHYDAPSHRVHVIPCGVDTRLFNPLPKEEAKRALGLDGRPWFLFVGRLEPIKGLDTLLKAMRLLQKHNCDAGNKPALLIIGGDKHPSDPSRMESTFRREAERLDLKECVFFMGSRPQGELPLFYAASEACILPSRYESFGMVALEAMACGTPVIASRVGGLSYTVLDGITGYLVPEGDSEALAQRIALLLHNPTLREALSRQAVARAKAFTWDRVVASLLDLYGKLTSMSMRDGTFNGDVDMEDGSRYENKGIR